MVDTTCDCKDSTTLDLTMKDYLWSKDFRLFLIHILMMAQWQFTIANVLYSCYSQSGNNKNNFGIYEIMEYMKILSSVSMAYPRAGIRGLKGSGFFSFFKHWKNNMKGISCILLSSWCLPYGKFKMRKWKSGIFILYLYEVIVFSLVNSIDNFHQYRCSSSHH